MIEPTIRFKTPGKRQKVKLSTPRRRQAARDAIDAERKAAYKESQRWRHNPRWKKHDEEMKLMLEGVRWR